MDVARPISTRRLAPGDLPRIADIDRSEAIRVGYRVQSGELVRMDVRWDSPAWLRQGDGEHSVSHQIAFCKRHMDAGATALGAFDGPKLVGIGLLTPEIRPRVAQLAYLHVSAAYRRARIGSRLTEGLLAAARERGASRVYVSATPSESAVGFYRSFGFRPTSSPIPELYALEPDDIHMLLELG